MTEEEPGGERVGIVFQGDLEQAREYEALLGASGVRALVVPPPPEQASP